MPAVLSETVAVTAHVVSSFLFFTTHALRSRTRCPPHAGPGRGGSFAHLFAVSVRADAGQPGRAAAPAAAQPGGVRRRRAAQHEDLQHQPGGHGEQPSTRCWAGCWEVGWVLGSTQHHGGHDEQPSTKFHSINQIRDGSLSDGSLSDGSLLPAPAPALWGSAATYQVGMVGRLLGVGGRPHWDPAPTALQIAAGAADCTKGAVPTHGLPGPPLAPMLPTPVPTACTPHALLAQSAALSHCTRCGMPHTHTHTYTHTRRHAHTHIHTHAHTHAHTRRP